MFNEVTVVFQNYTLLVDTIDQLDTDWHHYALTYNKTTASVSACPCRVCVCVCVITRYIRAGNDGMIVQFMVQGSCFYYCFCFDSRSNLQLKYYFDFGLTSEVVYDSTQDTSSSDLQLYGLHADFSDGKLRPINKNLSTKELLSGFRFFRFLFVCLFACLYFTYFDETHIQNNNNNNNNNTDFLHFQFSILWSGSTWTVIRQPAHWLRRRFLRLVIINGCRRF
jgi:hypothetical protein